MEHKDIIILKKIYNHIDSVLKYCGKCASKEVFQSEPMRVEACVFNLMQVGELAKTSLSEEFKEQIKTIPWKQLYGLRNRIVHGYAGVDMSIVWDTISNDLPALKAEISHYLD